VTGQGPWNVTWLDGGAAQQGVSTPAPRQVSPTETMTYTMTATDPYSCSATTNAITIRVRPAPPAAVVATAQSASTVLVSWSFSGSADSFQIERYDRVSGSPASYRLVGTAGAAARAFTDNGLSTSTAFLYRVRAVRGGTTSDPSGFDVATTVMFGADVVPGNLPDDEHILKLRTAVNAVWRLAGNTSDYAFTDPALAGAPIRAVHVLQLMSVLSDARANLSLGTYNTGVLTPPPVSQGPVRAMHINQLRGGVQ
jgi:hypothetical protein